MTSGTKSRTSECGLSSRFGEESGALVQHQRPRCLGHPQGKLPRWGQGTVPGSCSSLAWRHMAAFGGGCLVAVVGGGCVGG